MRSLDNGRRAVTTALLVALMLAGCGSDGSERLSRDELIERAEEICARHLDAVERLEDEGLDPTDDPPSESVLDDFARVLPRVADEFRGLADELRELEPPEDLDEQYNLTLDRIDRVADQLDRAAEKARQGDMEEFRAELAESAAGESVRRFFKDNGFRRCA